MKVLATLADTSACGYYRVSLPLTEMNLHRGHRTQITMQLPIDPTDPMYDVDVFVVQRIVDQNIAEFIKNEFREHHPDAVVIYEIDDLVTHLHPTNTMAWDYYAVDDRLDIFRELVGSVDAVTTTTPTLAEELRELNPHVFALDNCLPNWTRSMIKPEHDGPVRIVYTGGPSHLDDVQHLKYGIGRTITQLGDKVTMHTYGHPWQEELGLGKAVNVQFRPWTLDFPSYQTSLAAYDIGLAPLKDTRFNRSKSSIKVYEYWAAGIVPVVSDVGPYVESVENGVDGFLCRTDNDWRRAIMDLVENPDLLASMREAGYKRVPDLLIGEHAADWERVYSKVLSWKRL